MATKSLPDPELLRNLLEYDPATGSLTWRERDQKHFKVASHALNWNKRYAGKFVCLQRHNAGYRCILLYNKKYLAHRVIWAVVHGQWPTNQIDHINGVRDDNRLCNLRAATYSQNSKNSAVRKDNKSGFPGVHWVPRVDRWSARISVKGKWVMLGYFKKFDDAVAARKSAESIHGYHRNHGRN